VTIDDAANTVSVRDEAGMAERMLLGEAEERAIAAESRSFSFDGAFPSDATQRDIFSQVGLPVLRECMNGFNGTILAYGQTGSGKTYSLLQQGQRGEDAGLLPRLVAALFLHVAQDLANVYQVDVAVLQVYDEQIDDLLHPEHQAGKDHCLNNIQSNGSIQGLT
jgi:kinesin family protein 5